VKCSYSGGDHISRGKIVDAAAFGSEPVALIQQARGLGQVAGLVQKLAKERTGEAAA